jgi:hypothetical protein
LTISDYLLAAQLNAIIGISFKIINNECYYSFRSLESDHITKLIEQQKVPPKWRHYKKDGKQTRTNWVAHRSKVSRRSESVMNFNSRQSVHMVNDGNCEATNTINQSSVLPICFGENSEIQKTKTIQNEYYQGSQTPVSSQSNPIQTTKEIQLRIIYQNNCDDTTPPVNPNNGIYKKQNSFNYRMPSQPIHISHNMHVTRNDWDINLKAAPQKFVRKKLPKQAPQLIHSYPVHQNNCRKTSTSWRSSCDTQNVNTHSNSWYQAQNLLPNQNRPYMKKQRSNPMPKREIMPPFNYFKVSFLS